VITPEDLMAKAERALFTASNNLRDGDPDAAAARAYYAALNAAPAALARVAEIDAEAIKTHAGLIARFSAVLFQTGRVAPELGRTLALLAKDRAVADYDGRVIEPLKAAQDIEQARAFVEATKTLLSSEGDAR
jgi:uncharacterized protein (UPF0332 family)